MSPRRFVGVVVPTFYLQAEGRESVLGRLADAGASAICVYPTIGRRARAGRGVRFPDLHGDGYERILDRPLWGHRELQLETHQAYPSFPAHYAGGPYQPSASSAERDSILGGDVLEGLAEAAHMAGLEVHLLLHPLVIPGLRDHDAPISMAGNTDPKALVAATACPSSLAARTYAAGVVRDAVTALPGIDGLFLDWAEFRAYALEDVFACVCEHCRAAALTRDLDWTAIVSDLRALVSHAKAIAPDDLARIGSLARSHGALLGAALRHPGVLELARLKADSVAGLHAGIREMLDREGHHKVALTARGWPPPWNLISGMDYAQLSLTCGAIAPKLFTFDYATLPRWYGQAIQRWNPHLPEGEILDALVAAFDLPDSIEPRVFDRYHMPRPGEPNPTAPAAFRPRVAQVTAEVAGRVPVYPIVHAYLPDGQWAEMLEMIASSPADGAWVQMYGYLSNARLASLRILADG